MKNSKINVAIVGLGFGAEFIPIYQEHPNVSKITLCDVNPKVLCEVSRKFEIKDARENLEEILSDQSIDAVHIATPPMVHAMQSVAVLQANKHCACAVPMALTLDEIQSVINAQRASQKNYMMMETAVYTRAFLFVKDLIDRGEFGTITFARGAHLQDMERWDDYWLGFPPLVHISHAISPVLSLLNSFATEVHCFGSGLLRDELSGEYGNPYPFETAIFKIADSNVAIEVSRCMYQVARSFTESFSIYGDLLGFEWPQLEKENPILFRKHKLATGRGGRTTAERVELPDFGSRLPEEISQFTQEVDYRPTPNSTPFVAGGDHGGSHPHLVHEFVRSIIEKREPEVGPIKAGRWAAAGICAHESAMKDGASVRIPDLIP